MMLKKAKMTIVQSKRKRAFAVLAAVGILAILAMVSLSASSAVQITRNYSSQVTREWTLQTEARAAALATLLAPDTAAAARGWKPSASRLSAQLTRVNDSSLRVRIEDSKMGVALEQVYERVDSRVILVSESRSASKATNAKKSEKKS